MSDLLSLDDLLSIKDSLVVSIDVPEWGRKVYLARPTGARRGAFDRALPKDEEDEAKVDTRHWRARTVALCLATPEGAFLVEDPADAIQVGEQLDAGKSAGAIARLFEQAKRLAGMELEEEAEKN
jgi:hypothetical protein